MRPGDLREWSGTKFTEKTMTPVIFVLPFDEGIQYDEITEYGDGSMYNCMHWAEIDKPQYKNLAGGSLQVDIALSEDLWKLSLDELYLTSWSHKFGKDKW